MSEQRLIDANVLLKTQFNMYMGFLGEVPVVRVVDINRMPTIEAEPVRHGRWEEKFFTNDRQRVCSVCHCTVRQPSYDKGETALFNYCPHCGARMDGDTK